MSDYYLVGDVGGTKTDLAVYFSKDDTRKYVTKQRFQTADYPSLENLIATFLENNQLIIKEGILSVAGPVLNDRVTFSSSNLPWEVERFKLINELNIPEISLINDLEAVAISIPFLKEDDLYTINQGIKEENKTLAIIAPGTGLGRHFCFGLGKNTSLVFRRVLMLTSDPGLKRRSGFLDIAKKHLNMSPMNRFALDSEYPRSMTI